MGRPTPKRNDPWLAPEPGFDHGLTLRGRAFTGAELLTVKAIVEASPEDHRFALSKKVCEALGWYQANGRLKDRSCRDVLGKLADIGFLRLPAPRRPAVSRRPVPITARSAPRAVSVFGPRDIDRDSFSIVTGSGNPEQERLWNEYVERYHALGFGVAVGPHIKYFVTLDGEPIACIAFAGAAWRVEARDRWIGWSSARRERNLRYVVNNSRFVIFPFVEVRNLASRILALAARRVADDWFQLYAYRPLLLETFVDTERHLGTCYRAANWLPVGFTKGRGKLDRRFEANKSIKSVLLYPLAKDAPNLLSAR